MPPRRLSVNPVPSPTVKDVRNMFFVVLKYLLICDMKSEPDSAGRSVTPLSASEPKLVASTVPDESIREMEAELVSLKMRWAEVNGENDVLRKQVYYSVCD